MKAMTTGLLTLLAASATQASEYPFEGDTWKLSAAEAGVVQYLGERAMRIKGGYAEINHLTLQDGLIEFDIAVGESRGFAGAIFRVKDLQNYEHFYIRPHQSGNADANQYTPVFNGFSAWQLYHGPGYGAPVQYRFNEWMHIRIAFAGNRAEMFIDSDEPVLIADGLRRDTATGGIGFGAGNFAPAYFANFEVSALPEGYHFTENELSKPDVKPGTIMRWEVSEGIAPADVAHAHKTKHTWSKVVAESTGITNLATAPNVGPETPTVIARLQIKSARQQQAKLNFGYSDDVTVYVNGEALYSGSNLYQSRDYRYLGTIGLFDTLYLPLDEGENEVLFVVTEAFGGWGIQAQFEDMTGISLRP